MARRRVLALGLDCFEISFADRLIAAGRLPALAERREHDAHLLLDPGADQRTGLAWEQFWSGLSPVAAERESAVEFDPATYDVWQEGARFAPFFPSDTRCVVFDAPYVDLDRAPGTVGVVGWGAHDPGLPTPMARPASLLRELERRVGPYPGDPWLYATPWASPEQTEQMGRDLVAGVDARSAAAEWLLTEHSPDWDLAVVVASEPHSGAEGLWHGIDPTHPLHDAPSGAAAGAALTAVYEATDRLVDRLVTATDAEHVIVFSMGGMGPNRSDPASMVALPELLLRWSLGEERLHVPAPWAADPAGVPVGPPSEIAWRRSWFAGVGAEDVPKGLPSMVRRAGALLPPHVRRRVQRARARRREAGLPLGYRKLDWMPAAWYADRWPAMRAFALPSFYDGRVRVNLRGREEHGLVDPADYERVLDEIETLLRECTDPRTGRSVVESIDRPGVGDPMALGSSLADLVVVWAGAPLALEHERFGCIGPLPYRRTGGHTSPFGFASVTGPGVVRGDLGIAGALDVAPTIAELLTGRAAERMSGRSLVPLLSGAGAGAGTGAGRVAG